MHSDLIQPVGVAFFALASPMVAALFACVIWFHICKRICRAKDARWVMDAPGRSQGARPSDRLFLGSLAGAGALGALYMAAWMLGITPATAQEREFIEMARTSSMADERRVQIALKMVDKALYVSREDFQSVASAIGPR